MGPLKKIIEFIATFVTNNGGVYLERKFFDFLWEKIKPVLLKAAKKLCQLGKDRLRKMKKKWLDFRQRKRVNVHETLTLIFMNEYRDDNHSYVILIMIIAEPICIIIIVVISKK